MSTNPPHVVILNGKPSTGKSFYLQKIHTDLGIPYIARDEFKELLFDHLGIRDSDWSRVLGGASYTLLFSIFEKLLQTRGSFIIENNFNPKLHTKPIQSLLKKYDYEAVEIFLETEPQVLFERYKKRWESGERHRGHADNERFDEFKERLRDDVLLPLGASETIIRVDTTDFHRVDYDSLKNELLRIMTKSP